jgi:hypothetical protein
MPDVLQHPPPATVPTAPAARAMAATGPGRVAGLDGIRGLAALFVVLNHIFERAWAGYALAAALLAIVLTVVFELPFQPHRGWIPLRQAMSARLHICRLHIWRRDACDSPGR